MSSVQIYFDQVSLVYADASAKGFWRLLRHFELCAIKSFLKNKAGLSVLELGCGAGFYARILIACQPRKIVLVDFSQNMLDCINIAGVEKICANIEQIEFKENFDLIVCAGALEFVQNPSVVFAKIELCLTERGEFLLLAPVESLTGIFYRFFHRSHGISIHMFSRSKIEKLCAQHGLMVIEEKWAGPFSHAFRIGRVEAIG